MKKILFGALAVTTLLVSSVVPANAAELEDLSVAPSSSIVQIDKGSLGGGTVIGGGGATTMSITWMDCVWWRIADPARFRKYCM